MGESSVQRDSYSVASVKRTLRVSAKWATGPSGRTVRPTATVMASPFDNATSPKSLTLDVHPAAPQWSVVTASTTTLVRRQPPSPHSSTPYASLREFHNDKCASLPHFLCKLNPLGVHSFFNLPRHTHHISLFISLTSCFAHDLVWQWISFHSKRCCDQCAHKVYDKHWSRRVGGKVAQNLVNVV